MFDLSLLLFFVCIIFMVSHSLRINSSLSVLLLAPIMEIRLSLFSLSFFLLFLLDASSAQMPGFVSFDCGGQENFTDDLGLKWTPDSLLAYGVTAMIYVANETRRQYKTLRHFPADSRKYCYTLKVIPTYRYLVRATFLYGNFDNNNHVNPKFDISLGATIAIYDASTIEVRELIFLASSPTISVCLSNASSGQPFISTLELRQFNGSIYFTDFEDQYYLSVSARINFGADIETPVRYPDDPFDRIWESDSVKKADYLVDVAAGTMKVSTKMPIDVSKPDSPPEKVMQTAVVVAQMGHSLIGYTCMAFLVLEGHAATLQKLKIWIQTSFEDSDWYSQAILILII